MRDLGFETTVTVVESWETLRRKPNWEEIAGVDLFNHVFESHPEIKTLFGYPITMDTKCETLKASKKFRAHATYFVLMLDKSLNLLGPDIDLLTEVLQDLGRRHTRYGVTKDMFPHMLEGLLLMLEDQLGKEAFTDHVREAWIDCWGAICDDMLEGLK